MNIAVDNVVAICSTNSQSGLEKGFFIPSGAFSVF